jgi:hypothetical protein
MSHRRGEAGEFRVPADHVLVLRDIDAEGLVPGNVAVLPVNGGGELLQGCVRLGRSGGEAGAIKRTDVGDITTE